MRKNVVFVFGTIKTTVNISCFQTYYWKFVAPFYHSEQFDYLRYNMMQCNTLNLYHFTKRCNFGTFSSRKLKMSSNIPQISNVPINDNVLFQPHISGTT